MLNIQLYNKSKNQAGYIDKDGIIKHDLDTYWVTTDFMQVTPGSKCTYNGITYVNENQYGAFYDDDMNFVSTFKIKAEETEFIIPDKVFYVRFSLCRHTKINLFSQELEKGSINETSGSNEAGDTFRRTKGYIDIGQHEDLIAGSKYTISTTKPVYQMSLYYYRKAADGSIIYNSYTNTPFNQEIDSCTFTIPNINTLCGLRVKFYNPYDTEFDIMLNSGEITLPYTNYIETNNDDTTTFNFYIWAEAYLGFREELYEWMKTTLSPNLTEDDLDIIVRLMCYIFGDLSGLVYHLKSQIDPDKAEEMYLKHLGSVIGYEWNNALTAEQQRESIKLFIDLQEKRGTTFSLQNLIAVFGQDKNSYYSTSDLRGVKIIEGGKNGEPVGTADSNGLYPGDINIEVPMFSTILKNAIDNIRLIGTRIIFTYVIYCGPFDFSMTMDAGHELNMFFDPAYWGYDPTIEEFTSIVEDKYGEDYKIDDFKDWPIVNTRVKNCQANCCCVVYTSYKKPFDKGYIWNEAGNQDYKGFLIEEKVLKEDDSMYGYGNE